MILYQHHVKNFKSSSFALVDLKRQQSPPQPSLCEAKQAQFLSALLIKYIFHPHVDICSFLCT